MGLFDKLFGKKEEENKGTEQVVVEIPENVVTSEKNNKETKETAGSFEAFYYHPMGMSNPTYGDPRGEDDSLLIIERKFNNGWGYKYVVSERNKDAWSFEITKGREIHSADGKEKEAKWGIDVRNDISKRDLSPLDIDGVMDAIVDIPFLDTKGHLTEERQSNHVIEYRERKTKSLPLSKGKLISQEIGYGSHNRADFLKTEAERATNGNFTKYIDDIVEGCKEYLEEHIKKKEEIRKAREARKEAEAAKRRGDHLSPSEKKHRRDIKANQEKMRLAKEARKRLQDKNKDNKPTASGIMLKDFKEVEREVTAEEVKKKALQKQMIDSLTPDK